MPIRVPRPAGWLTGGAMRGLGSAPDRSCGAERPIPAGPGDNTFPGLTALRGIAAILVVLFHAPNWGFSAYFVSVTQFAARGYIWVDLFFMLSGFVMAHAYGGRFIAKSRGAWRAYLTARVARVYPLHLLILLVLAL